MILQKNLLDGCAIPSQADLLFRLLIKEMLQNRLKELEYLLYPDVEESKRRISQVSTGPNSPLNATSSAYNNKDKQSLPNGQNNTEEKKLYSIKESAPTFYSNAMNAVKSIKQEKATPEQWLKMVEKAGGLKALVCGIW